MGKAEPATLREVYTLVDGVRTAMDGMRKEVLGVLQGLEKKVDDAVTDIAKGNNQRDAKVANIEGKIMMIPVLISIAIGIFGLVINIVLFKLN